MLQNEYLDAKIGVDTAENEPSKDLYPSRVRAVELHGLHDHVDAAPQPHLGAVPVWRSELKAASLYAFEVCF